MAMFIEKGISIYHNPVDTWKALKEERKFVKTRTYNFNADGSEYDMDQEYPSPFGTAKCSYHVVEHYPSSMYFTLIKSNCFGKLRGHWLLVPFDYNGSGDKVVQSTRLTMYVEEVSLKVPLPGPVVKHFAVKTIEARMKHIKALADQVQADLSQAHPFQLIKTLPLTGSAQP